MSLYGVVLVVVVVVGLRYSGGVHSGVLSLWAVPPGCATTRGGIS
jgi:hypothetical protein